MTKYKKRKRIPKAVRNHIIPKLEAIAGNTTNYKPISSSLAEDILEQINQRNNWYIFKESKGNGMKWLNVLDDKPKFLGEIYGGGEYSFLKLDSAMLISVNEYEGKGMLIVSRKSIAEKIKNNM